MICMLEANGKYMLTENPNHYGTSESKEKQKYNDDLHVICQCMCGARKCIILSEDPNHHGTFGE